MDRSSESSERDSWSMGLPTLLHRWTALLHRFPICDCRVSVESPAVAIYLTSTDNYHRMKVLLFALLRSFEFELGVPVDEIVQKST